MKYSCLACSFVFLLCTFLCGGLQDSPPMQFNNAGGSCGINGRLQLIMTMPELVEHIINERDCYKSGIREYIQYQTIQLNGLKKKWAELNEQDKRILDGLESNGLALKKALSDNASLFIDRFVLLAQCYRNSNNYCLDKVHKEFVKDARSIVPEQGLKGWAGKVHLLEIFSLFDSLQFFMSFSGEDIHLKGPILVRYPKELVDSKSSFNYLAFFSDGCVCRWDESSICKVKGKVAFNSLSNGFYRSPFMYTSGQDPLYIIQFSRLQNFEEPCQEIYLKDKSVAYDLIATNYLQVGYHETAFVSRIINAKRQWYFCDSLGGIGSCESIGDFKNVLEKAKTIGGNAYFERRVYKRRWGSLGVLSQDLAALSFVIA